jgi:hypothetical protein
LHEFGIGAVAAAEHWTEATKIRRLAGEVRRQIGARHRNGEIGPQTQGAAVHFAGEHHAAADVLAAQLDERLHGLQHRRRDRRIAGATIGGGERLRPRVHAVAFVTRHRS